MRPGYMLLLASLFLGGYYFRNTVKSMTIRTADALANKDVQAFLAMIRRLESNNDYKVIYGGTHFDDYSKHPNIRIPFHNKRSSSTGLSPRTVATLAVAPKRGDNDFSTAAGAYQINKPTYNALMMIPGLPGDFTPQTQDILAVELLKLRGVLNLIIDQEFNAAVQAASGTWASLPFSTDLQNPAPLQIAMKHYQNAGGRVA